MIAAELQSPYKGLVPFDESELDALLFFGRERESEIIGANVLAARLTVLYGPSGVGKTSVLRAGVAHSLRARARTNVEERGHPEFAVVLFDGWSDDPAAGLRAAVRSELSDLFGSALLDEREGESLADTLERWTEAFACDVLLILDQAEEYFLYHAEEGGFADELPELVTRPGLRVRTLLSLRDDALSKLDRFKGRIPNLFANYLRLDHLDLRAARDAITKPVERYNELAGDDAAVTIEPALVEAVLEQTVAGKVDLGEAGRGFAAGETGESRIEAAFLQLVLERVWDEERSQGSLRLRAATLEQLGGAEAIVRAHLRRAVDALSGVEKDLAADVFRYLVTPSGTKIAHGVGDLAEYAAVDEQSLLPVLSTLGRERIVRTVDGAGTNGARYEIFHDVLAEAVLAWRRERERERERRSAERRHRRLLMLAVGALVAVAAMAAVAIYAVAQRGEARSAASDAHSAARSARARELAALAVSTIPIDPLKSVEFAAQAARREPTAASEGVLRDALVASRVLKIFPAGSAVNSAALNPDDSLVVTADEDGTARIFSTASGETVKVLKHGGPVTKASFSADGKQVVTSSRDRRVRLWTARGRKLRTLEHDAPVLDFALSPDSSVLVSTTDAGTVYIWRLTQGGSPQVFHEPVAGRSVAISSDGRFAAVVGGDRVARVYDLASGIRVFELLHDSRVLSAAFGPRKELLATGTAGVTNAAGVPVTFGSAQTWDLRRGTPGDLLRGHYGRVVDVAVSPRRGQFLATASADGTARVWDIGPKRGELISILARHTNQVRSVSFSPDGLSVVTASRDGTARVWKTDRPVQLAVLAGHTGPVSGAVFDRTGERVLTWGEDGTARLWDSGLKPDLRPLVRQKRSLTGLDVSPDGRRLLTTDVSGIVRIWTRDGRSVGALPRRGPVGDARFSPDGKLVATASADRTARIWSVGGSLRQTLEHPARVLSVAFSPDGSRVATASADRAIRFWRTRDGTLESTRRTGRYQIVDVSFSPDGRRLVSAGTDKRARIWNVATGRQERVLAGHNNELTSAAFSPDGNLVVTASLDHDARLWDANTGDSLRRLSGHFAIVSDARFSADGRWIVTAGPGTAGLWETGSGRPLPLLQGKFKGKLRAAAFAPSGYTIFTAGPDGTLRTYNCEVCRPVSDLSALADRRLARAALRHR